MLMRIRIQVTKMMRIRIRIHNTATCTPKSVPDRRRQLSPFAASCQNRWDPTGPQTEKYISSIKIFPESRPLWYESTSHCLLWNCKSFKEPSKIGHYFCHTKRWDSPDNMVKTASQLIIRIVKNPFFALQNKPGILFFPPWGRLNCSRIRGCHQGRIT